MAKPIAIINPVTGERSFTKHPELLPARARIESVNGILFGYFRNTTGCRISVVDRWFAPRTAFEFGALYEPPDTERKQETKKESAYQRACSQLGLPA